MTTGQDIDEAISEAERLLNKASETSTTHEADHLRARAQVMLLAQLLREVRKLRAELADLG